MRKHAVTVFLTLFAMLIAVTAVQANSIDDIVKVYGEIESVSDDAIVIDGKAFAIDDNTSIDGDPEVGAEAYVLGYTNDAGERIAKRIWVKPVDTATYIYGRISAVSDSEVVIDEQTVVISAETKIRGDLEVGAKAQVIADENEDGTLVASLIAAYGSNNDDHDDNKEYETTTVEGDISAVSDTAITVDTTTFIINEDTEISGDLTVGATARVRGYAEDGGDWIAKRIRVKTVEAEPIYIRGELTVISDTAVVIDGETITVSDDTKIYGDLEVGVTAYALAYEQDDGSLIAKQIAVRAKYDDYHEHIYVMGDVIALSDTSITIDDTTFVISDTTTIQGDIAISTTVGVKGYTQDGVNIAKYIQLIEDKDRDEHQVIAGTVATLTNTTLIVDDTTIAITDDTTVKGELAVGVYVVVKATANDTALEAEYIRVAKTSTQNDTRVKARGPVEAISDSAITVAGTQFIITDTTRIRARGDIVIGVNAAVRGYTTTEGTVVAKWIKVFDGEGQSYGHVESISGDEVVVSGIALNISGNTFVDGTIALGDEVQYVVGDSVSRGVAAVEVEYLGRISVSPTAVSVSASSATNGTATSALIATVFATVLLTIATAKVVRKV